MILTHHGIGSCRLSPEQSWTDLDVPAGVRLLHDFGEGPVPGIPTDNSSAANRIVEVVELVPESAGVGNRIVDVVELVPDRAAVGNRIVEVVEIVQ